MYDFVDRPVTSLDHGSRFLVWSMRSWVLAMADRQCPGGKIAGPFARWGMLPGLHPFLRMMALFNRHGLANFEFCALACNHVSEHEAIILQLVNPGGRAGTERYDTLTLLVEEECLGDLIVAIAGLSSAIERSPLVAGGGSISRML